MKLALQSRDFPVWQGVVSLEPADDWIKPWRIPYQSQNLFHPQLCIRAAMPAGVRITFRSDTSYIEGQIEPQLEENQIDLYCDKAFIESVSLKKQNRFLFTNLPSGEKLIELWLPQKGEFLAWNLSKTVDPVGLPMAAQSPNVLQLNRRVRHGLQLWHANQSLI